MIVPDSVSCIHSIADHIGCIMVGNMNDARYMVMNLRQTASEFKYKFQYEIPVKVLA